MTDEATEKLTDREVLKAAKAKAYPCSPALSLPFTTLSFLCRRSETAEDVVRDLSALPATATNFAIEQGSTWLYHCRQRGFRRHPSAGTGFRLVSEEEERSAFTASRRGQLPGEQTDTHPVKDTMKAIRNCVKLKPCYCATSACPMKRCKDYQLSVGTVKSRVNRGVCVCKRCATCGGSHRHALSDGANSPGCDEEGPLQTAGLFL